MIWDTHAHIDDQRFQADLEEVIKRAQTAQVSKIMNVGYDLASSVRSVELTKQYEFIYAAVGVHPHDAQTANQTTWDSLRKLAQDPKVLAWGEIGLDYYRDLSPRDVQQQAFIKQIEIANECRLPIIIHNREAHEDVLRIVREHRPKYGGVFHCFSGSWEMGKILLELGFYLSFAGPLTYKNARQTVEVAARVPLDRFFVETDAPYLTPEPHRGHRNEPAYVREVVHKIAELRDLTLEEVAACATRNAETLFGLIR